MESRETPEERLQKEEQETARCREICSQYTPDTLWCVQADLFEWTCNIVGSLDNCPLRK